MATDLDKPYVINGDDLRIVLSSETWTFNGDGHLMYPEAVARTILDDAGKPLEELRAAGKPERPDGLCEIAGDLVNEPEPFGGRATTVDEAVNRARHLMSGLTQEHREQVVAGLVGDVVRNGHARLIGPLEDAPAIPLDDDPEINAIRAVTGLLSGLDHAARRSVMRYLADRVEREDPF